MFVHRIDDGGPVGVGLGDACQFHESQVFIKTSGLVIVFSDQSDDDVDT